MYWDVGGCNLRYIGSKTLLLDKIEKIIRRHTTGEEQTFCDLFCGTGSVARYFKPYYQVITNDTLHFSYVLQKATIENNEVPQFIKLKKEGIEDVFSYLEEKVLTETFLTDQNNFIERYYSPNKYCNRKYFSPENARRIDYIRTTIETWLSNKMIDEREYYYLLAGLIEGVPYVSNITGTYGAFLKSWDKRALKNLEMIRLPVYNNHQKNECFREDANHLIEVIEGDILYLDPPYNSRQYASNYHLLETISKYDTPEISGITGMRPYKDLKSKFNSKAKVEETFEEVVAKAKFEHLVMSYSTEGLMNAEQISRILNKYGDTRTFAMYSIPYRKYKAKLDQTEKSLYEYMFYIHKQVSHRKSVQIELPNRKMLKRPTGKVELDKEQIIQTLTTERSKRYVKSPLNYAGGKYKLLPQIQPVFPKRINQFVDLFCGGCNVAVNVTADKIIANDINSKVIEIFQKMKETPLETILEQIESNIELFDLSKTNERGFLEFRKYYNQSKDPIDLYTLTCYSFNYQCRFNNQLEFNNPFGRNRSQFSKTLKRNLILFVNRIQSMELEFRIGDFGSVSLDEFGPQDFIYCDPPYYITNGTYNDGNRGFKDWRHEEEKRLYEYLDEANERGIRFAMSNVIEHKGKNHEMLDEWSKKYQVLELNRNYSNASYNTERKESKEILVINYQI